MIFWPLAISGGQTYNDRGQKANYGCNEKGWNYPELCLVALAVRSGWSTPEEKKSGMVDELIAIVNNPELPAKVKVAAFNALRMADQSQWERDHPDEAAKAKGSAAQVSIHIQAASTIREMIERGEIRSVGAMLLPPQPSTSGDSGQQCEVETSSTS